MSPHALRHRRHRLRARRRRRRHVVWWGQARTVDPTPVPPPPAAEGLGRRRRTAAVARGRHTRTLDGSRPQPGASAGAAARRISPQHVAAGAPAPAPAGGWNPRNSRPRRRPRPRRRRRPPPVPAPPPNLLDSRESTGLEDASPRTASRPSTAGMRSSAGGHDRRRRWTTRCVRVAGAPGANRRATLPRPRRRGSRTWPLLRGHLSPPGGACAHHDERRGEQSRDECRTLREARRAASGVRRSEPEASRDDDSTTATASVTGPEYHEVHENAKRATSAHQSASVPSAGR